MKQKLNEELILALKNVLPEGESMVDLVSEILSMGKESVYRRLRSEVLFTFDEVAQISKALNVSLDNIIGIRNIKRAVFDLNVIDLDNPYERCCEIMEDYVRLYQDLGRDPNSKARLAFNMMPHTLSMQYKALTKYQVFRWMNQFTQDRPPMSFSQVEIPQKLWDLQAQLIENAANASTTHMLLDGSVFLSFVRDVAYFVKLRLITPEELAELKNDLFQMLDDLEALAVRGSYPNGREMLIYLSQIDLKDSYTYYECKEYKMCEMRAYTVNGILSYNNQICKIQLEWIDSLKRYSTLISQSGEIQRAEYLDLQRDYINKYLKA